MPSRTARIVEQIEKSPRGSQDALDHRASRRGGFSKSEKRAYAREKFAESLLEPPKNPLPTWLTDSTLLPKRPPIRRDLDA